MESQEGLIKVTLAAITTIANDKLWGDIRRSAKENAILAEMLEQVILYHHLTKKNKNG
jgi:hypothetical protein